MLAAVSPQLGSSGCTSCVHNAQPLVVLHAALAAAAVKMHGTVMVTTSVFIAFAAEHGDCCRMRC
jgi:hypothetical protein